VSDSVISHAGGVFAPGHLGELTRVVPFEMVDAALAACGGRQQRVRLLPSRVVVYLLLAGALFAGQGWGQVWSRVTASLPGVWAAPAGSSLTQAMRRVGIAPLRELFDLLKGPVATTATQTARFAGRLVVAIDGTTIAVPDTGANRAVFPKAACGPNGPAGYPLLRVVAIVACGTRSVIDAVFGTDAVGELTYARDLSGALHRGMLLLADRNFATTAFTSAVAAAGADFLIRAKTGSRARRLPVQQRLADGSFLSHIAGLPVRVIEATITARSADGTTQTGHYRLVTTLLDPHEAPAITLARLYHQRWEIETAYLELKSTILGGRVLRAQHPAAVIQETWALLTAYQVLRTAMADAVLHRPDLDPDRASLTIALNTARDQITQAAAITTDPTDLTGRIGTAILSALLPNRRPRIRARVTKRAISKYRATTRTPDRRTRDATINIQIHNLTPEPGT
jgi:hypothetical protein